MSAVVEGAAINNDVHFDQPGKKLEVFPHDQCIIVNRTKHFDEVPTAYS